MSEEFEKWACAYRTLREAGTELLWPSETLVRLFKGSYVPGLASDHAGKTLLDVGCGNGNNLVFLSGLGLACSAVEVSEELCREVAERFERLGRRVDVRPGTNRKLPFESGSFDFLVSWNVLHYEDSERGIDAALEEYSRVLRRGGRVFISTTGPEHKILKDSVPLGSHRFRIGREDDFRRGQVFYYFETPENIERVFSRHFSDVVIGRTHDQLFSETLDWFVVTGLNR